ncbi:MAG: hypothetical protein ACYS91_07735 [Planctomycetota bacterium]|jgi:hypothetical protein
MVIECKNDYLIIPAQTVGCYLPLGQIERELAFFPGVNGGFVVFGLAGCVAVQDFLCLTICKCVGQAG